MKFKEFLVWCNERACDGCWGMTEAMICIAAIEEIKKAPLWKRKRKWEEIEGEIVGKIVNPTNKKIAEVFR